MKRLLSRLYRALMFVLALLPAASALYRVLLCDFTLGVIWLAAQTLVASLLALFPAYVGNYREYEVVRYENRSSSLDPNPDRETRRERVSEGHRFPLRLSVDIVALALNVAGIMLLKRSVYESGNLFCMAGFLGAQSVLLMLAMSSIASAQCFWLDIPGIMLGAASYLIMAIYLKAGAPPFVLRVMITAAAVVYLFLGAVSLNRQSIAMSMASHTGDTPRAPRQIAIRNRRIVLGFASAVTVVSMLSPIRSAILWLVDRAGDLAKLLLRLIGIGGGSETAEIPMDMMDMAMQGAAPMMEMAEESGEESYLIVYIFLGIVALGTLWLIFDLIRRIVKKLTKWMEKFASGVNEGFYDEREELMTADEMRQQLRNSLRNGLKALLSREPSWESLNGRERMRRLMRDFYKKRAYRLKGLRAMTAREALAATKNGDNARFGELYDRARYSSHEVDADEADRVKKEMKL